MKFDASGWLKEGGEIESTQSYDATPNSRKIIVMHYTAGYTASSAVATFKSQSKPRSSAHFVVDVDGRIIQMVSTQHIAWHSGFALYREKPDVNGFSIGIEIVNPGYHFSDGKGGYLNWERKPVSAAKLAPFPGFTEAFDPWVGSKAFWPNFPLAQLNAVEKLTLALLKAYPSLVDVVGHRDIDTARRLKVDPGPAFPLRRFRMLLDRRDANAVAYGEALVFDTPTLNVRGGPGTSFQTLDWGPLREGEKVAIQAVEGDWDLVVRWINGKKYSGWVFARYLRPI